MYRTNICIKRNTDMSMSSVHKCETLKYIKSFIKKKIFDFFISKHCCYIKSFYLYKHLGLQYHVQNKYYNDFLTLNLSLTLNLNLLIYHK